MCRDRGLGLCSALLCLIESVNVVWRSSIVFGESGSNSYRSLLSTCWRLVRELEYVKNLTLFVAGDTYASRNGLPYWGSRER